MRKMWLRVASASWKWEWMRMNKKTIFNIRYLLPVFSVGMSTIGLMGPTSRSPSNALLPSISITSWPGCKTSWTMRHFSLQRSVWLTSVFSHLLSKPSVSCGFYVFVRFLLVISYKEKQLSYTCWMTNDQMSADSFFFYPTAVVCWI